LQRGLKVYKEVCSACHGLSFVAFRNLADSGGPGYSVAQAAAFASDYKVKDGPNDQGEMFERPGRPADYFPSPFPNEQAARAANGGAAPPDLSLITKARHEGPEYVYSLLTGYPEKDGHQPAAVAARFPDAKTPNGTFYNPYFANLNIAMPPPLTSDGQVTYLDGTRSTVDQNAKDVAAFLTWAAEPKLEARHTAGLASVLFLLIFCFLAWGAYKNVWRDKEH
jgi:cytochrome c1